MITISYTDLWLMLLSMVRYSLGRRSYIVSSCCECLDKYGDSLLPAQKGQIRREICEELSRYELLGLTCGDECDHMTWINWLNMNGVEYIRLEPPKNKDL